MHTSFRNGFEKTAAGIGWGKPIPPPKLTPTFKASPGVTRATKGSTSTGPQAIPGGFHYGSVHMPRHGMTGQQQAARSQS